MIRLNILIVVVLFFHLIKISEEESVDNEPELSLFSALVKCVCVCVSVVLILNRCKFLRIC